MAGISNRERERRHVEDVLATTDRPFRDPSCAVIWVGPVQRGWCEPCQRRDWGAQIRLGRGDVFRCADCLQTMANTLDLRATEADMEYRQAIAGGVEDTHATTGVRALGGARGSEQGVEPTSVSSDAAGGAELADTRTGTDRADGRRDAAIEHPEDPHPTRQDPGSPPAPGTFPEGVR